MYLVFPPKAYYSLAEICGLYTNPPQELFGPILCDHGFEPDECPQITCEHSPTTPQGWPT